MERCVPTSSKNCATKRSIHAASKKKLLLISSGFLLEDELGFQIASSSFFWISLILMTTITTPITFSEK
jgi:hypothetical protein